MSRQGSIGKVLVANRGEIAGRIIRTLRDLNIESVALCTESEANAPHVWLADHRVGLRSRQDYLDAKCLVDHARAVGADAIHPGYGFLSENPRFAEACVEAGLTFIGPSAQAIRAFADKREARALAEKLGVPVVPGAQRCDELSEARSAADHLGFPVVIKSAGGGGGKGMRRVGSADQLAEAFHSAQREAESAFGDPRLMIEKLIEPARHVEVQILGDGRRAVALGDRECSLQRRYQKVVEEAPCLTLDRSMRQALFADAIKLAEAVGYLGAGTVEFLLGTDAQHYFLEVNTRLQVEHPVTEATLGLDLVAYQIHLAEGGSLPQPRSPRGHAIEVRINAEDPYRGFLPTTGPIQMLRWTQHPGLRIDSGIEQGSTVTPDYDPLLAKVIAWGQDREHARRRLLSGLQETTLLGVTTNRMFLLELLTQRFFVERKTFTSTLEHYARELEPPEVPEYVRMAAGLAKGSVEANSSSAIGKDLYSPWFRLGNFRAGFSPE